MPMRLEWVAAVLGVVSLWSLWILGRRFVPGKRRPPSRLATGVAIALLAVIIAGVVRVGRISGLHGLETVTRQALPSGRVVEVVAKRVVGRAWTLEYRTRIPRSHHRALESEAEEIWNGFRAEAEATGATRVQLFPIEFSSELRFAGWRPVVLSNLESGALILEKMPDGTWKAIHGWPP